MNGHVLVGFTYRVFGARITCPKIRLLISAVDLTLFGADMATQAVCFCYVVVINLLLEMQALLVRHVSTSTQETKILIISNKLAEQCHIQPPCIIIMHDELKNPQRHRTPVLCTAK